LQKRAEDALQNKDNGLLEYMLDLFKILEVSF